MNQGVMERANQACELCASHSAVSTMSPPKVYHKRMSALDAIIVGASHAGVAAHQP